VRIPNVGKVLICMCLAMGAYRPLFAQSWPTRPITFITPLAVGSASDVALRIVSEQIANTLGQSILIDNQTGASGAIGAEKVANAVSDGSIFCGCNNAILGVLPQLRKVPYNPLKSFKPIGMVAVLPTVLVVAADSPFKSVKDLVDYAKNNPGKVEYASGGVGSPQHIAMAMFESMAGVKFTHVPYKGASQAAVGVASGEIPIMFNAIGTVLPLIKSGKLRPIAIAGSQRTQVMPDIPTVSESGLPGYSYVSWVGIVGPAGISDEIASKLSGAILKTLSSPEIVKRLNDNGIDPFPMSASQMSTFIAADYQRMGKLIKEAGITGE
jgi:tripartite-type tricarboxylate transporter receptor subunit TctC